MKEENKKQINKEKEIEAENKEKIVETPETKVEVKAEEKKDEEKKQKKEGKKEIPRKDKAIAHGDDLPISTKHAIAICNFIKGKKPEQAMAELEQVIKMKKIIPMKGEIPHRKGMMSGRYPVNASKVFINLLKSLIGNSNINGLEEPVIVIARADRASRPHRRFGSMRFKRTNVLLETRESKGVKN